MLTGIDHVQLAAPPGCEEEARRFFGELLGLEEIEKPARAIPGVRRCFVADPRENRLELLAVD